MSEQETALVNTVDLCRVPLGLHVTMGSSHFVARDLTENLHLKARIDIISHFLLDCIAGLEFHCFTTSFTLCMNVREHQSR